MANIEASMFRGKNNWALLMDEDGFIAEGSGDNFFIIKDNKVLTPFGKNCLVGISRNYIFEICEQLGIECLEKNIEPYDVYAADEAFITGTPFCILPVFNFNELPVPQDEILKNTQDESDIESLLTGDDEGTSQKNIDDISENGIEKSILDKIKNN